MIKLERRDMPEKLVIRDDQTIKLENTYYVITEDHVVVPYLENKSRDKIVNLSTGEVINATADAPTDGFASKYGIEPVYTSRSSGRFLISELSDKPLRAIVSSALYRKYLRYTTLGERMNNESYDIFATEYDLPIADVLQACDYLTEEYKRKCNAEARYQAKCAAKREKKEKNSFNREF